MGRPAPKIVETKTDARWRKLDVIEATSLYAVTYDGKLISLRRSNALTDTDYKYPKTMFGSRAYAQLRADELNIEFRTDKFSVRECAYIGDGKHHT
jgi:hypothetical protein